MSNEELVKLTSAAWNERVFIETTEHIITGRVFMPKIGKESRLLSEILNSGKQFIAVKDCTIEYKLLPNKNIDNIDFIQVNISTILYVRPL